VHSSPRSLLSQVPLNEVVLVKANNRSEIPMKSSRLKALKLSKPSNALELEAESEQFTSSPILLVSMQSTECKLLLDIDVEIGSSNSTAKLAEDELLTLVSLEAEKMGNADLFLGPGFGSLGPGPGSGSGPGIGPGPGPGPGPGSGIGPGIGSGIGSANSAIVSVAEA
jgi:hypothetical protein